MIHESFITLPDCEGELRQGIDRGNGREKPAIVISNDLKAPELLVGKYAQR